jgi:acyl dehydratase
MFAIDAIGRWTEPRAITIEPKAARAYARATDDELPEHREGTLAPPVFAAVAGWDALTNALLAVVAPEALPTLVHGEHDLTLAMPLEPGRPLYSRAMPAYIAQRSAGVVVAVRNELTDADGALVAEQWMTSLVRGAQWDGDVTVAGTPAPTHPLPDSLRDATPDGVVTRQTSLDQPIRYAAASGDHNPIHLDAEFAQSVGLPGAIMHGLCTFAIVSQAAILAAGQQPRALRRFAARFSAPVTPGHAVTTSFWHAFDGTLRFETNGPNGERVLRNGYARFGAPSLSEAEHQSSMTDAGASGA